MSLEVNFNFKSKKCLLAFVYVIYIRSNNYEYFLHIAQMFTISHHRKQHMCTPFESYFMRSVRLGLHAKN